MLQISPLSALKIAIETNKKPSKANRETCKTAKILRKMARIVTASTAMAITVTATTEITINVKTKNAIATLSKTTINNSQGKAPRTRGGIGTTIMDDAPVMATTATEETRDSA